MNLVPHIIAIFVLAALAAGWVGVQLLAKKMGTKNHFDTKTNCCGHCTEDEKENCSLNSKLKPSS